jgi:precorrin-6B methylase 2
MKPYALFPRTPHLFSSLNVQKNMLQDRTRNESFKTTIFRSVAKGDVVVDLGTGTGILAIWAAQAGARRVYAIEETDVAEVAEAVIRDNGLQEVITVLKANSSEVTLPESADILIAELVGHFLFEEGIVEAIATARDVLLKPGGRIIPQGAKVFLAPVELAEHFDEISFWETWQNPRLDVIRSRAANTAYVERVTEESLLAEPAQLFNVDFRRIGVGLLEATASFYFYRNGRVGALAGWFELDLGNDVTLSTDPWSEPTHWQQCVFPLESPHNVSQGERLDLTFSMEPFSAGCKWYWKTRSGSALHRAEEHALCITYGEGSRLLGERF